MVLLIQMLARVIKNKLRKKLRKKMRQLAVPMEQMYLLLTVNFLNVIFGNTVVSDKYWKENLKSAVMSSYEVRFRRGTKAMKRAVSEFPVDKATTGLSFLWLQVQKMTGLNFSRRIVKEIGENSQTLFSLERPFDPSDLVDMGDRVKHMVRALAN